MAKRLGIGALSLSTPLSESMSIALPLSMAAVAASHNRSMASSIVPAVGGNRVDKVELLIGPETKLRIFSSSSFVIIGWESFSC